MTESRRNEHTVTNCDFELDMKIFFYIIYKQQS